jgi:ornithine cyclodeaminase/alanine dehydrogenase-like protein (mu-crystallin family)
MKASPAVSTFSSRQFLVRTGAALALPTLLPASALSAAAPSRRINLGVVGCGNMGTSNLRAFLREEDCQVVAACGVDQQHLNQAVGLINRQYQKMPSGTPAPSTESN